LDMGHLDQDHEEDSIRKICLPQVLFFLICSKCCETGQKANGN
jgi:hypothetical protein